jgi:hypothetical protein
MIRETKILFIPYKHPKPAYISMIKKVDILNFITDSRKAPNDVKTHNQLVTHLGADNEPTIVTMLGELKAQRVVREVDKNGEKAYQVIAR